MIKEVLDNLKSELPATVKLVAVSKFHPFEAILEAYDSGQRIFADMYSFLKGSCRFR